MSDHSTNASPRWGSSTKMVMGLAFVAFLAILVIYYRWLLSPVLMAFVISYLISPVASTINKKLHFPWKFSVGIIYLLIMLTLLGLLTWGGIALVEQASSLIGFLQRNLDRVPEILNNIGQWKIQFGPFNYDFAHLDLQSIGNELLKLVEPAVSSIGSLLGRVAGGTISFLGSAFFVLLISFFILSNTTNAEQALFTLDIPGYEEDFRRLGNELKNIWNAFLRGQFVIILLTILIYIVLLGILGVKYFYVLAVLAGLARLVPYVGPWITWTTYFLVCAFQGTTILELNPVAYGLVVVGAGAVLDAILDNFMVPAVFSGTLEIHPAAVLIAAIAGANLLGLIGLVLAAPVVASLNLFGNYVIMKLVDKDPWERISRLAHLKKKNRPPSLISNLYQKIMSFFQGKIQKQK